MKKRAIFFSTFGTLSVATGGIIFTLSSCSGIQKNVKGTIKGTDQILDWNYEKYGHKMDKNDYSKSSSNDAWMLGCINSQITPGVILNSIIFSYIWPTLYQCNLIDNNITSIFNYDINVTKHPGTFPTPRGLGEVNVALVDFSFSLEVGSSYFYEQYDCNKVRFDVKTLQEIHLVEASSTTALQANMFDWCRPSAMPGISGLAFGTTKDTGFIQRDITYTMSVADYTTVVKHDREFADDQKLCLSAYDLNGTLLPGF